MGTIIHDAPSIKRLNRLINKGNSISIYHWEFTGIMSALVAKVRVGRSIRLARSRFFFASLCLRCRIYGR